MMSLLTTRSYNFDRCLSFPTLGVPKSVSVVSNEELVCSSLNPSAGVSGKLPTGHSLPFSNRQTFNPMRAARQAAVEPPYPLPTTTTSTASLIADKGRANFFLFVAPGAFDPLWVQPIFLEEE